MFRFLSKIWSGRGLGRVVLVTGGAGYIGSHTCKALKEAGFTPVVYDSLVSGDRAFVKWGPLVVGDIGDAKKLGEAFAKYKPIAVLHLAAFCKVEESVKDPLRYYKNNVHGSMNLLNVMKKYGVRDIIFSSSCTVYGDKEEPLDEEFERAPANPYARTKCIVEDMIKDYAKAYGMRYMILRYFNAAGVDGEAGLKRLSGSYPFLIYKIMLVLASSSSEVVEVYGSGYKTPDGTGIRDYIHVKDLADAQIVSLKYLLEGNESSEINLGSGTGYSVLEIIQEAEKVTKKKVPYVLKERRKGDIAMAIAKTEKAKRIIHFEPKYSDLETIIKSEWEAIKNL